MNFHAYKTVSVSALRHYDQNARTHSPAQILQLRHSIREFGWTNPVLIDEEGLLIAGHGRVEAAKSEGLKEVPAIVVAGLTADQRRALSLADNKLALNAGWDLELLSAELGQLAEAGIDMGLTGFSEDEIAALLATPLADGLTDPDDVPEPTENPVSALGDVWLLGKHRLVCGDCTDALVVEKALNGVSPHLMVTDPPYGVEYDADWRNHALRTDGSPSNGRAIGKVLNDEKADWRDAWALFPGNVAYIWHVGNKSHVVADSLIASAFELRAQIIWAKSHFVIGRGHYHPHHEPCWYAVRKGATGHWSGDRKQSTLWQIDKPRKSETGHSTQKPVECMKRPIENNSSLGQAVYEPFSGSGTTIIAAEMTGRCCHAIELNPSYVDVAIKRWQDFTGKEAIRESDRVKFAEAANVTQAA